MGTECLQNLIVLIAAGVGWLFPFPDLRGHSEEPSIVIICSICNV